MLSVAGRSVGDGVHVVGGPPPAALASLHPHQQDSKRQRLGDPHNMPQLRIDTNTRESKVTVVTTGNYQVLTAEREREFPRSQLQVELTSKGSQLNNTTTVLVLIILYNCVALI